MSINRKNSIKTYQIKINKIITKKLFSVLISNQSHPIYN